MLIICSECKRVITSAHNNKATVKYRLCFRCIRIQDNKDQKKHKEAEIEREKLLRTFKSKTSTQG